MNAQILFTGAVRSITISIGLFFGIFISQKVHAENYPPECGLSITEVPEYLFGGATYATPITFKITGCEKARIKTIKGKFIWEGKKKDFDIRSRYGVGDKAEIANDSNWGLQYTCFVPASFYQGVICEVKDQDHRNWDSAFILSVTFEPFANGKYWDPVTLVSEPGSGQKPKVFVDVRVFCKEFPAPGSSVVKKTKYTLKEAGSDLVSKEGDKLYYQLNHSSYYQVPGVDYPNGTDVNGFPASATYPAIIPSNKMPPSGVIELIATNGPIARTEENGKTSSGIASSAKLRISSWSSIRMSPYPTYKAAGYGNRIGIYFYVSYGGKVVPPLGVGEPAMDLGKKVGTHSVDLFTGRVEIEKLGIESGTKGSILGQISGAAGIGWAIRGGGGPFAMAFGLVSSIASLMASVDKDAPSNVMNADGMLTYGFVKSFITDEEPSIPELQYKEETGGIMLTNNNEPCIAGEQYTYFVQADAAVTLQTKSIPAWGSGVSVFSKAAFITPSEDFVDVTISTY